MPQRVKVYEENVRRKGVPLWGWVLLLVVVLTVLVMFFAHRADQVPARPATAPVGAPAGALIAPARSVSAATETACLAISSPEAAVRSFMRSDS